MSEILWLHETTMNDLEQVGGKNASLGELITGLSESGVRVPGGFATTATAFQEFLSFNHLDQKVADLTANLDIEDVVALARVGKSVRELIIASEFQPPLREAITNAYAEITSKLPDATFAVRSSATAEDLPEASFAGQQETFLNIHGLDNILSAVKLVFASLYNDRAIAYRVHHGFTHSEVALSAGIQQMIRSDEAVSGVMFSVDTESGFDRAVFITSSYGLGEAVVQGAVNPDEFYVYKPSLAAGKQAILKRGLGEKALKMVYTQDKTVGKTIEFVPVPAEDRLVFSLNDAEVTELARYAVAIEKHYGRPMDIEWAKDGIDQRLYILQARPETVNSRQTGGVIERFTIKSSGEKVLSEGRAIGQRVGAGPVRVMKSIAQMQEFQPGEVLVADMTDPDWEPIMKRASAIVTNRGGRTCHAAIIARELGIPAVVGTGDATSTLFGGTNVTVSCAEGDTGRVYEGLVPFEVLSSSAGQMPEIPVKLMMNVGTPDQAFSFSKLPNHGVGLARMEFIINRQIGIHPNALLNLDSQETEVKQAIQNKISAYASPREFYVSRLAEGMSMIAAAFDPHSVIFRLSDFKSNEYANLIGGARYEPHEENPMIGFRGASRYISKDFEEAFKMECEAVKRVRDDMGLKNLKVMIPFVRTLNEARQVSELLVTNGLERGKDGLQVMMMCEIPSNALLADQFLEYFDGFSIGSNDMTQLTLGLDRDSALVAAEFDERNEAVKKLLSMAIDACQKAGKYVGICGQGPSDHPDLAAWLVDQGIESISLNPDTVLETWMKLAK